MTENTGYAAPPPGYSPPPTPSTPPSSGPPSSRPPLRRTTGDARVLGGVAAGIARTLGIDPILIRVAFVVLTIFGGSGVLLYLAGWLFIPEDGRNDSSGERFFRDSNALAVTAVVVIAVLVVAPMLAWGWWGDGPEFGGLLLLVLVIIGIVALVRHNDRAAAERAEHPATSPPPTPTMPIPTVTPVSPTAPTGGPLAGSPASPPASPPVVPTASYPAAPPPPPAPRERSVLGKLTVGAALLVSGILIALDLADVVSVKPSVVIATALAVVAAGLLVGTILGRSRGLIVLGVALVLVLVPVAAIPDNLHVSNGVGERNYKPTTWSQVQPNYELGTGSLTLDLRRVDVVGAQSVDASVGVGEVVVLLPPDVPIDINAHVGAGVVDYPHTPEEGGLGIDKTWSREGTSSGSLDLELDAGLGSIQVVDQPLLLNQSKQPNATSLETR